MISGGLPDRRSGERLCALMVEEELKLAPLIDQRRFEAAIARTA
jgi:hypothetical protein